MRIGKTMREARRRDKRVAWNALVHGTARFTTAQRRRAAARASDDIFARMSGSWRNLRSAR